MKKPILFSILAVVLVACYCFWGLAPSKPVEQEVTKAPVQASLPVAVPSKVIAAPMPATAASFVQRALITQDRTRVYDSQSILATIQDVRRSGTQDEKDWANSLLGSCVALLAKPDPNAEEPPQDEKVVKKPDDPELAAQKKHAIEVLLARCKGIDQLSVEDRRALRAELTEGHARNPSVLGQLHAIDGDRWSGDQAKLISESLYSSDPVVARAAFFAILAAFDSSAPGGTDRQNAFMFALGPQFTGAPLSEFERLQGCRNVGWCASWGTGDNASPSWTVSALADKYRSALQSHADARSILAIR